MRGKASSNYRLELFTSIEEKSKMERFMVGFHNYLTIQSSVFS